MSHLGAMFAIAKPMLGFELDQSAFKSAAMVSAWMGLTSKSDKRERRPTLPELDALLSYFEDRQKRVPHCVPMVKMEGDGEKDRTYERRDLVRVILNDGRDAGDVLVKEGLAQPWPNKGNKWCTNHLAAFEASPDPVDGNIHDPETLRQHYSSVE